MLEGINDINWERIGYGESLYPENIPHIVHRLISNDTKAVSKALDELYDEMILYSDQYPSKVAIMILPFLFETLLTDGMLLKEELLDTLHYLLKNSVKWLKAHPDESNTQFSKHIIKFISALDDHTSALKILSNSPLERVNLNATRILLFYDDELLLLMERHK